MSLRGLSVGIGLAVLTLMGNAPAQQTADDLPPQSGLATATLHTGTQLVVLDATVFDKAGHIVTQVLGKDDFLIEENKRPQAIRNFEAPLEHLSADPEQAKEKAPHTIIVLDELNSHYIPFLGDKANLINLMSQQVYARSELVKFLREQPATLRTPTEILLLTHHGFQSLVPSTRDRDEMVAKVAAHNPGLGSPFRDYIEETGYGGTADGTLTKGSMAALWALALEQRSLPGRKNLIWLGWGGPNQASNGRVDPKHMTSGQRYVREITDLLVAARITLNVMGPGLSVYDGATPLFNPASSSQQVQSFNFEGDFGFAGYATATGGQIMNGNDMMGEIAEAENYGMQYYTLTYRPEGNNFDGRFRRIKVSIKGHPDWTVLTKAGYYSMQYGGEKDEFHQLQSDLSMATFETMPFHALGVTVVSIERVSGTDLARFKLRLRPEDLEWHTQDESGRREADVAVSAAALSTVWAKRPLNSKVGTWKLTAPADGDPADTITTVTVIAPVPPKTQRVRFVVRDMSNARMGTVDESPAAVASAPEVVLPMPSLQARPTSLVSH